MHPTDRRQFRQGFWATALGTLASRVLGMLRDAATASLLGLAAGGVMDAFVLAFRLANLARRLLGEGALATSYLPVLTSELERDRASAMRLAAAVLGRLAGVLTLLVLVGEVICGAVWFASQPGDTRLLAGLTAALLPYLLFICLAAQLSATLHALGKFRLPALAATLLNVSWLSGAWWAAPRLAESAAGRAYVLAGSIVLAGGLQAAIQLSALGRLGMPRLRHWHNWCGPADREAVGRVLRPMGPIALALSVTQLNTLVDSAVAWLLTPTIGGPAVIGWLPGSFHYPLHAGATAALYYAERFYQLPVGLLGVAAATVIFPQLSRHAARGDCSALAGDLTAGVRMVICLSLPAAVGLVLLAEPLANLVLAHGAFHLDDVARTVATTRGYAAGLVGYCALPLVLRGFYAVGDARRPLVAAAVALAINGTLDLSLAWPLGEAGLALATAVSSLVQLLVLGVGFSRLHAPLDWRSMRATAVKSSVSTAVLALAVVLVGRIVPADGVQETVFRLGLSIMLGGLAFLGTLRALKSDELATIWPIRSRATDSQPDAAPLSSDFQAVGMRAHTSPKRKRGTHDDVPSLALRA